jgi:hypothetical protein
MWNRAFLAALLLFPSLASAEIRTDTQLAREWDQHLRGKKLTQLSSYSSGGGGGGYSAERVAYFCRDGSFYYFATSSVSVYGSLGGSGSAGGTTQITGRWRVVTDGDVAALEINNDRGEHGYMPLGYENGKTFVDGTRTFVTDDNNRC